MTENSEKMHCMECQKLLHINSCVYAREIVILNDVTFWNEQGNKDFFRKIQREYYECNHFHKWFIDREIK